MRRLRLLAEFAARGTVAATAEALHLTGSAVSQQLAALEKEAGVPLLLKRGRRLELTAEGQRLVDHAHVVLGNLAAAESDLAAMRRGERGSVRIAAFPTAARALLPRLWPDPGQVPPPDAPVIQVVEHEPHAAEAALRKHQVDIAVTHTYSLVPRPLPPGCEQRALFEEPVLLVLHPADAARHGLSADAPAELGHFADAPWLLPGPETACHEMAQRACGAAGFVPRPVAVANDFTVLTALITRRAGVALIPRPALPAPSPELSVHTLTTPVRRSVQAVYHMGMGRRPDIAGTLDMLVSAAASEVPAGSRRP
ncbi:LysR family transcriptional regulator [Streptomyces camelliae]|uniref:LysR family transcriptional regulator n=1 Tax=Streptomyces camelliae TaxID=3004093 RepID=A0ABY7P1I5_9ACTN|nr:LysR family transcriptional regulator [Streptomyces sp. HUAS 2-6]WBO63208.1 LysR family transcriptional regulator [Streptomyces sp. HUAS 2-6]